jgi:hypothetical protein
LVAQIENDWNPWPTCARNWMLRAINQVSV